MAQVLVTMPDAVAPRVVAAFCKNYGYQATISDGDGGTIPNPETLLQFVFRQRIKFIKDNLKGAEVPDLAKTDRAAKLAEIDAIVITMEVVV